METLLNLKSAAKFIESFCFICQEKRSDKLSIATSAGIDAIKDAAKLRKELGQLNDIIERVDTYLQNVPTITIRWHKVCYSNFKNKKHIDRLKSKESVETSPPNELNSANSQGPITRSKIISIDFDSCAFCQDKLKKGT